MNAVMRILRYLKFVLGKGILFTKNVDCQSVDAYSDADWAGAIDDRRSCDTPNLGGPLTTRQLVKNLWMSDNQTPLH